MLTRALTQEHHGNPYMKTLYNVPLMLTTVWLVVFGGHVLAGPTEDMNAADAAADRGDFAAALAIFRPLAEKGNPRAQANLGAAYLQGVGVPKDPDEGYRWLRKAANQGDQNALALLRA